MDCTQIACEEPIVRDDNKRVHCILEMIAGLQCQRAAYLSQVQRVQEDWEGALPQRIRLSIHSRLQIQ